MAHWLDQTLQFLTVLLSASVLRSHKIDPETVPRSIVRRRDNAELQLVMSDEFSLEGRSFAKGDDDVFEAQQRPDDINQAISFYNSSAEYVSTKDGSLVITTQAVKTSWVEWNWDHLRPEKMTKNYTSGMIQSWNKFCFTGGVLELSIKLPGHANSGGIWPAAWLMGNLARTGYQKSTVKVWPWSYSKCGDIDNLDSKQEINACNGNPGYGMHPHKGRGAPEIDLLEVMPGHNMPGDKGDPIRPFVSSSLQVSPGVTKEQNRPINGERLNSTRTWYDGIRIGEGGEYNYGFWGAPVGPAIDKTKDQIYKYQEDAISVNTFLEETHFDRHHTYRLEWQPGPQGYLDWYIDDGFLLGIDGQSLQELTGSFIPEEPMYLILNTAISHQWGMPEPCDIANCPMCWRCYDCTNPDCQCTLPDGMKMCKNLPAQMELDFIRLYQDVTDDSHSIGCSTKSHPTAEFIKGHADRYADWSPYKGSLSVNSELIPISLYSLAILLLISVFAYLRWNFLVELFSSRFNFSRGYSGIPEDSIQGPGSTSIQMT